MRRFFAAAGALMFMAAAALAADTEGEIRQIDSKAMTITLDDGKIYKLPPEMDMTAISEGTSVIIAYDSRDGVNQITDMVIQ